MIAVVIVFLASAFVMPRTSWARQREVEKPKAGAADPADARTKPIVPLFRLKGEITERDAPRSVSFDSRSGGSLRELVGRLDKAAADKQIKAIVIVLDPSASAGPARIEELRQAIQRVRDAGKEVFAHADELTMGQYVLLSGASRLSVSPSGMIAVAGLYTEDIFLRGLLDTIGAQPDFMTCGEFKSAADMFMRHAPSAEADAMRNWLLDSLFDSYVGLIAVGRNAKADTVRKWIDGGPYSAESARTAGVIDAVEHPQDLEQHLKSRFGDDLILDPNHGRKAEARTDLSTPIGLMKLWAELLGGTSKSASKRPTVAVVHVEGPIVSGGDSGSLFEGETASATTLRRTLDDVARDDTVKAVVLRVNSPGGSASASEIILDATKRVKARKPLIVSMGDVAGSGGYYVACGSDTILADAATITASIGVVSGKLATTELFENVGIRLKAYRRGANAGMFASGARFTESERQAMRERMDEVYATFKGHVSVNRVTKLKKPLDEIAGGRVYTGKQALELGLIDRIGTLRDAIEQAAADAALGAEYEVRSLPRTKSIFESMLTDTDAKSEPGKGLLRDAPLVLELAEPMLRGIDPDRLRSIRAAFGRLELLRREGVVLTMPMLELAK